jgi:hypothetical protein
VYESVRRLARKKKVNLFGPIPDPDTKHENVSCVAIFSLYLAYFPIL